MESAPRRETHGESKLRTAVYLLYGVLGGAALFAWCVYEWTLLSD